jgi:hypothetical protein
MAKSLICHEIAVGAMQPLTSLLLPLALVAAVGGALFWFFIPLGYPYASLNTPVIASAGPDSIPSRADVLAVYPKWFVLNFDNGHRATVAAHKLMWEGGGLAVCFVGYNSIKCPGIALKITDVPFETLTLLPISSLNKVVPRHGNGDYPSTEEVLKYYPPVFAVDWEGGKVATVAAADVASMCTGREASCDIGIDKLNCLCGNFVAMDGLTQGFDFDPYYSERHDNTAGTGRVVVG